MSTVLYPSKHYPLVTPNDTTDLALTSGDFAGEYPRGLSVQVAGTVRVTDLAGNVQNFTAEEIPTGVIKQCRVAIVHSTGTSATGIRVYY